MLAWLQRIVVGVAALVAVVALVVLLGLWMLFGTGEPYADLTGEPLLAEGAIEPVLRSEEPVGNIAVTPEGRIFYMLHPLGAPQGPRLYEWVDGEAVPFPGAATQAELFATPLGLALDGRNRLWVTDPGNHGLGDPQLLAFDLDTGEVVHRHLFERSTAPWGSYLQDLAVSDDGAWVYVADAGFWSRRPGLVVYDVERQRAHRALSRHETVRARDIVIRTATRPITWLGGIVSLKVGVDGIALSADGAWLYYGAMNHDTLYRVPVAALQSPDTRRIARAVEIQTVGRKPLSEGIALGPQNTAYITDVEHGAVMRISESEGLQTVVRDPRIRWPDGLAVGPDGWMYLSDSALPELIGQSAAHRAAAAPYTIWRFRLPPAPPPSDPMLPPRFTTE